ncbi:MAG: DHH family phosphoesterase [Bariatricus sp.]
MAEMTTNRNRCKMLVIVLVAISIGIGGFFVGRAVEASRYKAEQKRNIMLNRSDLDGLGEITGTIYVTGHRSPDSDTVGSSIAYAHLLCELGYDAQPVVLGKINNESKYILNAAGLETPMVLQDAAGCNMVLVDHSEYMQSAEGLQDANIISIIDHHADGTITTAGQLIYDARPLGSTSTIIWMRYRDYGVTPDRQTALVMMGAILSDTKNIQSENTTYADREALKELSELAGITDVDAFYQDMYEASISYEGMTDEEIFFSDYKEYECGGIKFSIGNINAYDEESAKDLAERMLAVFPSALESTGMDMAFAQINVLHDDISFTCLIPSDDVADEVLENAFSDTAVHEEIWYKIEPYASRKKVVVPAITNVLEAYPME